MKEFLVFKSQLICGWQKAARWRQRCCSFPSASSSTVGYFQNRRFPRRISLQQRKYLSAKRVHAVRMKGKLKELQTHAVNDTYHDVLNTDVTRWYNTTKLCDSTRSVADLKITQTNKLFKTIFENNLNISYLNVKFHQTTFGCELKIKLRFEI